MRSNSACEIGSANSSSHDNCHAARLRKPKRCGKVESDLVNLESVWNERFSCVNCVHIHIVLSLNVAVVVVVAAVELNKMRHSLVCH